MTRVTFSPSTHSLYFYSASEIFFVTLSPSFTLESYETVSDEELEERTKGISDWVERGIFEWAELAPRS